MRFSRDDLSGLVRSDHLFFRRVQRDEINNLKQNYGCHVNHSHTHLVDSIYVWTLLTPSYTGEKLLHRSDNHGTFRHFCESRKETYFRGIVTARDAR